MKITPFKRFSSDDLGPKAPDWMLDFLGLINMAIENVNTCVNGRITFSENHLAETQSINITSGVNQVVYLQTLKTIKGQND